jgi:hypothetical protein
VTDIRAALGAHRRSLPCEHCGTEGRQRHDRTCPKAKRGRTSRARGNAYERDVAHRLGARRTGMYGGKDEVNGDWIVIQAKNGGAFPERIWRWLEDLPHGTERLRAVVIGDAPGPGTKRREVIVLDFEDFCRWFGK